MCAVSLPDAEGICGDGDSSQKAEPHATSASISLSAYRFSGTLIRISALHADGTYP
jgi:hypothetical protein